MSVIEHLQNSDEPATFFIPDDQISSNKSTPSKVPGGHSVLSELSLDKESGSSSSQSKPSRHSRQTRSFSVNVNIIDTSKSDFSPSHISPSTVSTEKDSRLWEVKRHVSQSQSGLSSLIKNKKSSSSERYLKRFPEVDPFDRNDDAEDEGRLDARLHSLPDLNDGVLNCELSDDLEAAKTKALEVSMKLHEAAKQAPLSTRVRRRFQSSRRRHYRRLIFKNGECNISHANIKKRKRRFLADIFTTLVDIQWRYTLLLFVCAFILSWIGFAVIWWIICYAHEDFRPHLEKEKWVPCVDKVTGFSTALLFSIETQHTIGYGYRVITNECPEAIMLIMFQSCFGVIIQALMTGLVFAKLSRPKKRAETLMFSKNAVICKRDGIMTLLFRVGDMRRSQIIEAHVRACIIRKRITSEGEILPMEQFDVNVGYDCGRDRVFLVWPVIIEHKIDEESPFWEMSAQDLKREQFEFLVILEGIVESTGMTTQARSSYLPNEILWGHRFEKLITYQKDNGEYLVDYEKFHCVKSIPHFPECSARELAEIGEENASARGLIQDDDISLASKSQSYSVFPSNKRNGSLYGCLIPRSNLSIALHAGQPSSRPTTPMDKYSTSLHPSSARQLTAKGGGDLPAPSDLDSGDPLLEELSGCKTEEEVAASEVSKCINRVNKDPRSVKLTTCKSIDET